MVVTHQCLSLRLQWNVLISFFYWPLFVSVFITWIEIWVFPWVVLFIPVSYSPPYAESVVFLSLCVCMCVQTSRKLWTCLCGNTLFFFNDKKDTDVRNYTKWRNYWECFKLKFFLMTLVCAPSVHRDPGSQPHDLHNRRQQPGSQLRGFQTQPPDEGWKHQIHCETIYQKHIELFWFYHSEIPHFSFFLSLLWSSPQVPSAEARELWKGFIHSIAEVRCVRPAKQSHLK